MGECKNEFHKIISKIAGNYIFQKNFFFFLVELIQTKRLSLCSFLHTARKMFLSEKIEGALWKNDEISQISQLRPKNFFWKKSQLFWIPTKIIKNVSQDVIKTFKWVFTLFLLRCWLDFIVLSLIRRNEGYFLKKRKKIRKNSKTNKCGHVWNNFIYESVYAQKRTENKLNWGSSVLDLTGHTLL